MKLNKLGLLSLLALIGVLGLIFDRPLYGFFGFAGYARYFFVTPDEMFQQYVKSSASIGFFSGMVVLGVVIALHTFFPTLITSNIALASCMVISIFSFTIALLVYEIKEQRGADV
jgi:hypothetical protein